MIMLHLVLMVKRVKWLFCLLNSVLPGPYQGGPLDIVSIVIAGLHLLNFNQGESAGKAAAFKERIGAVLEIIVVVRPLRVLRIFPGPNVIISHKAKRVLRGYRYEGRLL